jgi:hypothetical protein
MGLRVCPSAEASSVRGSSLMGQDSPVVQHATWRRQMGALGAEPQGRMGGSPWVLSVDQVGY